MTSPYENATVVQYPDGSFCLERSIPTLIESEEDTFYTLLEDETLQDLAYKLWGDSGLWYIIAEANHIANPFTELKSGMKLRIPAYGIIE
jgi:nucleoid-associated protein YgaU